MTRWFPKWIFPVAIVLSVLTVWLRLSVVQSTYELNQAAKVLQNLKLEKEKMDLRIAQLKSPRRLESLAKEFGLSQPTADRIIQMR